jgi:hypothetical protein
MSSRGATVEDTADPHNVGSGITSRRRETIEEACFRFSRNIHAYWRLAHSARILVLELLLFKNLQVHNYRSELDTTGRVRQMIIMWKDARGKMLLKFSIFFPVSLGEVLN